MDMVNKRLHVLHRQAAETLLAFLDHIREVGELFRTEPADAVHEVFGVFGKMVGDRGQDRMEQVTGTRAGQVTAFRREFFQDCDILVVKFPWHGGYTRIIIFRAGE